MSQHLLAADRLAHGEGSQLLHQGYPLGPHAIVVALNKGLGIGLVQGFTGLTVAVAVLASLTALTAFRDQPPLLRIPAALVVGLTYMVASYFAQGSFKETMQALFFLAFVLALREASRNPDWRELPLRFVPAALLAVGSVYTYSFPGLIWLVGARIWSIWSSPARQRGACGGRTRRSPARRPPRVRRASRWRRPSLVLVAPEIGRMIDFHAFETFDPNGPGLGNLFGQISPFEALGIWPSGDFRLTPGDGAVPALGYYLGAAFASILLALRAGPLLAPARDGADRRPRRRRARLRRGPPRRHALHRRQGDRGRRAAGRAASSSLPLLRRPVAWLYLLAAGGCSLLALANAPVGPSSYSPALTGLRADVGAGPTLVLASRQLLDDEHGTPYIAWELRGGRVCIAAERRSRRVSPPPASASSSPKAQRRRPAVPRPAPATRRAALRPLGSDRRRSPATAPVP